MSFLGGPECSTAANPLSQFTKHVQDDKSLQRDRLVGRGPGGMGESMRTQPMGAPQDAVSKSCPLDKGCSGYGMAARGHCRGNVIGDRMAASLDWLYMRSRRSTSLYCPLDCVFDLIRTEAHFVECLEPDVLMDVLADDG